jgi:hypothetical protein
MRIETYTASTLTGTVTIPDPPEVVNEATLRTQAFAALAANRTALAVATPTNAQLIGQVKALTRQNNALIRLALNLLDGPD